MIRDLRQSHYQKLSAFLLVVFLFGWMVDLPWFFVSVAATSYLLWLLYQQHKLIAWLISGARKTPPDAMGLWGVVFDHLYKVQRDNRKQIKNYRDVIQRMRASTEALSDGTILLDSDGNIQWWNSAARKLLKLQKADMGQPLTNLLREPSFIKFYNSTTQQHPITILNPALPLMQLQISMTIFGKSERLLLIRDVSRLAQLETMRQDFVSNVSHELKTPITVLKGHLENILAFSENLPAPTEKALLSMSNQTQRMQTLVTDLLLLAKLDNEESIVGTEIDVSNLITEVVEDARVLSGTRNHTFKIDCQTDAQLIAGVSQIRSALSNLVINAVNYSKPQSTITICWRKINQTAILSVTDEGEGIDQMQIPRLTERFYRVDAGRSTSEGGTGLGLAIVKHALQCHEARLDISSQKNKGSTFSCVFPISRLELPIDA